MAAALIQYVVVRKDLISVLKWPLGAVIAQACHASSAIMFLYHDDPITKEYTGDLDRMHKCVLEVCTQHVAFGQVERVTPHPINLNPAYLFFQFKLLSQPHLVELLSMPCQVLGPTKDEAWRLLNLTKINDEQSIKDLSNKLDEANVLHKLWVEQPENIPTCLVTKPYRKEDIQAHFKKLKLFK